MASFDKTFHIDDNTFMINKAAICEDEIDICNHINKTLTSYFKLNHLEYSFDTFQNGEDLLRALSSGSDYALFFLDIEMPGIDGIRLAKKIRMQNPDALIIFISNKESLVFQSFEVRPFRFLRKNHFKEELPELIHALKRFHEESQGSTVAFENGSTILTFSTSDILYVEAMRKNCIFHTTTEQIPVRQPFSSIVNTLRPLGFIQSHRSYMVNHRYIYRISRDGITLDNDEIIPIGRAHLEQVKTEFQKYVTGEIL